MQQALLEHSRWLYTLLVVLVAVQRGVELRIAGRNYRWLLKRGGVEEGEEHYPWMVTLHTLFLVACVLEVWLLRRPFIPWLAVAMMAMVVVAAALRYWVLASLGRRWTTRVVCLPGAPLVTGGPYRWLQHPNYLAVSVEILALPLVHSAWMTAGVFSLANGGLLGIRRRVEEEALRRWAAGGVGRKL